MSKFKITDEKTGKTITVSGDKAPTQSEAENLFREINSKESPKQEFNLMETLANIQRGAGESEVLPITGSILGGMVGSSPGAGIGATSGKVLQQQVKEGLHWPREEEAKQAVKTGAGATLFDWFAGKFIKGAGKLAKKGFAYLDDVFKPAIEWVDKQILTQILKPSAGKIAKDLTKEGVSETIEEAQKRGIKGTAKQIYTQAIGSLKSIGSLMDDFLKTNADELPEISMKEVSTSLDDEIEMLNRMAKTDPSVKVQVKKLTELQKNLIAEGSVSFDDAWRMARDWSQQVSNYYNSGKATVDIKPYKARAYKLLNEATRKIMKEVAEKADFSEWIKYADDYHFWKNMEGFAKAGTSKMQTAVSSTRGIVQRVLPFLLRTSQNIAETGSQGLKSAGKLSGDLFKVLSQIGGQSLLNKNQENQVR